ncbi:serine/threonine-protein kinase Nek11-like [Genypterus blacodes]|uniref:serine/threonine-protein kinase Nek11-like n=1 Tax=Genypterus blacodes TaxID=154954 RepID=UPI003F764A6D
MLDKLPSCRPSAEELLKNKFIEENMKMMKNRFFCVSSEGERDAELIAKNMEKKLHLQTLRERSEVEQMTPRERMRLRKEQAADDKARRLRKLALEKYQEIHSHRKELRSRHFEKISLNVLKENTLDRPQPITGEAPGESQPIREQHSSREAGEHDIPEDPQTAEVYYDQDRFESCSEEEEEEEEEGAQSQTLNQSDPQDRDLEAMMRHMQEVLDGELSGDPVAPVAPVAPLSSDGPSGINSSLLETRIHRLRESVCHRLGSPVFLKLYEDLKEDRQRGGGEDGATETLSPLLDKPGDRLQVDQLLYYEEELQRVRQLQGDRSTI